LGTAQEFGRYGGEEFVVALPAAERGEANALAERIRQAVRAEPIVAAGAIVPLTVSIGGAVRAPGETSFKGLLARADQALYAAKNAGRDRVEWASETTAQSA